MLTPEHFEAQRQIIQSAQALVLAVTARHKVETILHVAFDPTIELKASRREKKLLRKIK